MRTKLDTILPVPHVVQSAKTLEVPLMSKHSACRQNETRSRFEEISHTDTVDLHEQLCDHYVLCSFVFDSLQVPGLDNLHDLRIRLD